MKPFTVLLLSDFNKKQLLKKYKSICKKVCKNAKKKSRDEIVSCLMTYSENVLEPGANLNSEYNLLLKTRKELVSECKKNGLKVSGKKAVLAKRIGDFLSGTTTSPVVVVKKDEPVVECVRDEFIMQTMNDREVLKKVKGMNLNFMLSGKTLNGFEIDVMKSGLQKYIRRGNLRKALWCMVELDTFDLMGGNAKIKNLKSNLRNRLIIILGEDVGIAGARIFGRVSELMKLWEASRNVNRRVERECLTEVVSLMCLSSKIRLVSHIKSFFSDSFIDCNGETCTEIEVKCDGDGKDFYKKKDSKAIRELIDLIVYNLNENNDNAFHWMMKLLHSTETSGRRGRKAKKAFIAWDIISQFIKKSKDAKLAKFLTISEAWYVKNNNSRNENIIYLINAFLFYLRKDEIEWDLEERNLPQADQVYWFNLFGEEKFEVDSFVVDMHCKKGRVGGKTCVDFAVEGSRVENESELFLVPQYKEHYIASKYKKVKNVKKEIKMSPKQNIESKLPFCEFSSLVDLEFMNDSLSRERTCGGKVMTFVNHSTGTVIKEMRESFNFGRDCCIMDETKFLFGIKKLNTRRVRSDHVVVRADKSTYVWKDNMKIVKQDCVYLLMDHFDNVGTLTGKERVHISNRKVRKQYLEIAIFRGLFRCTDSNYTNCLRDENNNLLSIDENNIGNCKDMFHRNMYKHYTANEIKNALKMFLVRRKKALKYIKGVFQKYDMEDKFSVVENVYMDLENVVYQNCVKRGFPCANELEP